MYVVIIGSCNSKSTKHRGFDKIKTRNGSFERAGRFGDAGRNIIDDELAARVLRGQPRQHAAVIGTNPTFI